MTPEAFRNLRALAEKARAKRIAPWHLRSGYEQADPGLFVTDDSGLVVASEDTLIPECAPFIAACDPSTVLTLLDELDRANAEIGRLKAAAEYQAHLAKWGCKDPSDRRA